MRPSYFRVTFALATFLCGIHLVNWRAAPLTPRAPGPAPAAPAPAQAPCPPVTPPAGERVELAAQEGYIDAPGVGRVRVVAYVPAEEGYTRLSFTNDVTGEHLRDVFGGKHDSFKPELRFRVVRLKGVGGPVVVGVTHSPGGSDSSWEAVAVAVVDGDIKILTYETLETSNQGGFYFGDLGGGRGTGAAVWDFVWDEDEGHYGEHGYEVKLYKWDAKTARFEWSRVLRTAGKFSSGSRAMRSLGLHFGDIRRSVHGFDYDELE